MYMRMKFYVDGTKRKGTVHLDLKKVRSAANVLWQAHTIALYSGTCASKPDTIGTSSFLQCVEVSGLYC